MVRMSRLAQAVGQKVTDESAPYRAHLAHFATADDPGTDITPSLACALDHCARSLQLLSASLDVATFSTAWRKVPYLPRVNPRLTRSLSRAAPTVALAKPQCVSSLSLAPAVTLASHCQPHSHPCPTQLAGIVNKELFTGVALEARFSTHGARQLQTDVEALCSVFRPYTARPAAVFKELLEACILLRLDAATADSLASMLDPPVDFGALVFAGWSAARTPPVARSTSS